MKQNNVSKNFAMFDKEISNQKTDSDATAAQEHAGAEPLNVSSGLPTNENNGGSRVLNKSLDIPFDVKFDDNEEGVFSGYGSTFGNKDLDGDVIAHGAFARSLASGNKIRLLWQHDRQKPIGVITEAKEDDRGLYIKGRLTMAVQEAREARALMVDGAIDSFSIGFRTKDYEYNTDTNIMTIKEAELFEVSIVTFPANPLATVDSIKSDKELSPEAKAKLKILEKEMKQAGLSRSEALDFVSKCKTASGVLSDSGQDALLAVLGIHPSLSDSEIEEKESDSFNEQEVIKKLDDCLFEIKLNSILKFKGYYHVTRNDS